MTNGRGVRSEHGAEGTRLRTKVGFALLLVLAGCTGVADPSNQTGTSGWDLF